MPAKTRATSRTMDDRDSCRTSDGIGCFRGLRDARCVDRKSGPTSRELGRNSVARRVGFAPCAELRSRGVTGEESFRQREEGTS